MKSGIKNPLLVGAISGGNSNNAVKQHAHHKTKAHYAKGKKFNRQRLPKPHDYYAQYFPALKANTEWVSVCCCFHDDEHPSLRLNLHSGAFRCFGCGAKGGDVLAFHQQRFQLTFIEAVSFLGAWDE